MIPKFRAWDKDQVGELLTMWTVDRINLDDGTIDVHVWTKIGHEPGCKCHRCTLACDGMERTNNFAMDIGERMILMQSTGLSDKNGAEIFKGDILEFLTQKCYGFATEGRKVRFVVKFGTFNAKDGGLYKYTGFHTDSASIEYKLRFGCEIIGNIHDNPKLLND